MSRLAIGFHPGNTTNATNDPAIAKGMFADRDSGRIQAVWKDFSGAIAKIISFVIAHSLKDYVTIPTGDVVAPPLRRLAGRGGNGTLIVSEQARRKFSTLNSDFYPEGKG